MSDASTTEVPDDILAMSFEDALAELDRVVGSLESGQAPLEESIALYTRGTQLRAHCSAKLKSAQSRIEKLTLDRDGNPAGTEPLDS